MNRSKSLTSKFGSDLYVIFRIYIHKMKPSIQKFTLSDLIFSFKLQIWNDQTLQWNPSEFGNIDHARLPAKKFWKPDIVLYNSYVVI